MFPLFNLFHYYCSLDFFPVLKGLRDHTPLSAIHGGNENMGKKIAAQECANRKTSSHTAGLGSGLCHCLCMLCKAGELKLRC